MARGRQWAGLLALVGALAGGGPAAAAAPPRVSMERVPLTDAAVQVPLLERLGLDVTEDVTPHSAVVVASSDAERAALRTAGLDPQTVVADYGARLRADDAATGRALRAAATTPRAASALPSGRTAYRTPAEVQGDLDALAAGHPGLVRRVVLPRRSIEGRPITGVEIADNVNVTGDGRPVYVVVGEHHAREWPSAEIAVEFALDLVAHQSDPRIAALLAGLRIIVIPVQNPDGFAYSRGTSPAGQLDPLAAVKRRNCRADPGDPAGTCAVHRGVDLNRNYGAYWGGLGASTSPDDETFRGAAPWSEPEAQAFHEFTQHLPVTGVQSLHNIAGLVLRPPGFRALGRAPDEAKLKALGDAMGAATGYASRFGYELYEVTGATEDWNYVAQGAFGYTIETAGAFPGDTDFHGAYQSHVVDQYLGGGASPGPAGQGVRQALLLAAAEAMDPRDHVVVRGHAPAGRTLRLHKSFTTSTSPLCSDTLSADACGPTLPALKTPDLLDVTLTVPASGSFSWHVGPSTRPFVRAAGHRETWTLTCERGGRVVATKALFGDRGQVVDVDPCDRSSLPRAGHAAQPAGVTRVSVAAPPQAVSAARRTHVVRLQVRCPVACRAAASLASGSTAVGRHATVALKARHTVTVSIRLNAAGRRRLARAGGGRVRLAATVVVGTAAGDSTTATRAVVLSGG